MEALSSEAVPIAGPHDRARRLDRIRRLGLRCLPLLAAGAYPFILRAFHLLVGPPGTYVTTPHLAGAAVLLASMFFVPASGLMCAAIATQDVRTRRLAYASVTAPTLYVFLGVVQIMTRSPLPDELVWCMIWFGAALWAATTRPAARQAASLPVPGRWRVAHGVAGAVVLIYVLFHLANHLADLIGRDAFTAVEKAGEHVYRAPLVEPLLVSAMLFQIGSGLYLAWRWSAVPADFYRLVQVGSGVYLSLFILGHMDSVFIYARTFLQVPTDWAFATSQPTGFIHDAWNIRLIPHYTLGVFLVLTHLCSGLRVVLIAHGLGRTAANRLWTVGAAASAVVAVAIIAGMCGVRIV